MTLLVRVLQTLALGITRPKIKSLSEAGRASFRVLPTDIDSYRHMNTAKYLNYMEAVRWDLQYRTGFLKLCIQNKWIAPIAKIDIRFLRALKVFQQFEVTAQIVAVDNKWFYIYQKFSTESKTIAKALVRSTLKSKQGTVPTSQYLAALGFSLEQITAPPEIKEWLAAFSQDH